MVIVTEMSDGRSNDSNVCDNDREHDSASSSAADSGGDGPFVVVYMVDSFTYGSQAGDSEDVSASRLATVGLLQCYSSMLKSVPKHLHSSIQLQVSARLIEFMLFCNFLVALVVAVCF